MIIAHLQKSSLTTEKMFFSDSIQVGFLVCLFLVFFFFYNMKGGSAKLSPSILT